MIKPIIIINRGDSSYVSMTFHQHYSVVVNINAWQRARRLTMLKLIFIGALLAFNIYFLVIRRLLQISGQANSRSRLGRSLAQRSLGISNGTLSGQKDFALANFRRSSSGAQQNVQNIVGDVPVVITKTPLQTKTPLLEHQDKAE